MRHITTTTAREERAEYAADCEPCRTGEPSTCPECFRTCGIGCGHGEPCVECVEHEQRYLESRGEPRGESWDLAVAMLREERADYGEPQTFNMHWYEEVEYSAQVEAASAAEAARRINDYEIDGIEVDGGTRYGIVAITGEGCPLSPRRALRGVWDALSNILESPEAKIPADLREAALKAVGEAQASHPTAVREDRATYAAVTEDSVMADWAPAKAVLVALLSHGIDDDADEAEVAEEFLRSLAAPVARALNAQAVREERAPYGAPRCTTDDTADLAASVGRRFHDLAKAKAHAAKLSIDHQDVAVVLDSPTRDASTICCRYWAEAGDGGLLRSWESVIARFDHGKEVPCA